MYLSRILYAYPWAIVTTVIISVIMLFVILFRNKKKFLWIIPFALGTFGVSATFFSALDVVINSQWGIFGFFICIVTEWFILVPAIVLIIFSIHKIFKKVIDKNEQNEKDEKNKQEKKLKNKNKILNVLIPAIVIITIIGGYFLLKQIEPSAALLEKDKETITKIINEKYPSYDIKSFGLYSVNFFSSRVPADEEHKAIEATIIIKNEIEQRTIKFDKNYFKWSILSDEPDYGPNVPNNIYFIDRQYETAGKTVDIEEYIKEYNYLVIPDENGNYYKKSGQDKEWYYSFEYCRNIFKTKDGKVYIFNKENLDWEVSNIEYSSLCYYSGNYEKVDKNIVINILERYSSYKEQ